MEAARARRQQLAAAAGGAPAAAAPAQESSAEQALTGISAMAPELVAPLVVYLCLDEASNINGRDFIVGGDEVSLVSLPQRERTIFREGGWDLDSLAKVFQQTLGAGIKNPKPAEA
jgi:hypothetical protein